MDRPNVSARLHPARRSQRTSRAPTTRADRHGPTRHRGRPGGGTDVSKLVAFELVGQAGRYPGLLSWSAREFEVLSSGLSRSASTAGHSCWTRRCISRRCLERCACGCPAIQVYRRRRAVALTSENLGALVRVAAGRESHSTATELLAPAGLEAVLGLKITDGRRFARRTMVSSAEQTPDSMQLIGCAQRIGTAAGITCY